MGEQSYISFNQGCFVPIVVEIISMSLDKMILKDIKIFNFSIILSDTTLCLHPFTFPSFKNWYNIF